MGFIFWLWFGARRLRRFGERTENQHVDSRDFFVAAVQRAEARAPLVSIAKQFIHPLARCRFAGIGFRFRRPDALYEFKILAEIPEVLVRHRIGAAFAALLRHARIVARAVQADAQIGAAFHAAFAAAGIAVDRPRLAAVVAMTGHRYLRLMIFNLRLRKQYARQLLNETQSIHLA